HEQRVRGSLDLLDFAALDVPLLRTAAGRILRVCRDRCRRENEKRKKDRPNHAGGNQRRIPRRRCSRTGPTRKMEPATATRRWHVQASSTAANGSVTVWTSAPSALARETSSAAGMARGDGAVVHTTLFAVGTSGASISRTALSFIAPNTSVTPSGAI